MFVDMRTWQIPKSDTFAQIKAPIKLDRRSQLSEIWLEDDATDADHIAAKFSTSPLVNLGFRLQRTQDISDFIKHCEQKADVVALEYIRTWVTT